MNENDLRRALHNDLVRPAPVYTATGVLELASRRRKRRACIALGALAAPALIVMILVASDRNRVDNQRSVVLGPGPTTSAITSTAALPNCAIDNFQVSIEQSRAATGPVEGSVTVKNVGEACALFGRPTLEPSSESGDPLIATRQLQVGYNGQAFVAPESSASFTFVWSSWCSPAPKFLTVTFVEGGRRTLPFSMSPACADVDSSISTSFWRITKS